MVKYRIISVGLYVLGLNCLFTIVTSQCTPPSVSNGIYTPNNLTFTDNETISYVCDTGYDLTSGDTVLTCLSNGSWSGTPPTCTIVQCSTIIVSSSSYLPNLSSHDYNTSITYSCDTGYNHTSGDLIRTCLQNGSWSGSTPSCSIVQCSTIIVPSSSYLPNLSSHDYNTSITYSCDTGYYHTSGDLIRTCLQNGSWSGSTPSCSIVECTAIIVPSSSYLPNLSSHDYNTSITYSCDTGYNHTSGDLIRTCLQNGSWSGSTSSCSIVQCSTIIVPSSSYLPNLSSHDYNTSITYSCDTGYNHTSGDLIRTCLQNGSWSGSTHSCSIIECSTIIVPSSSHLPNLPSHDYNTSIIYSCDTGFNHTSGDLISTCLQNGSWSGSTPTCSIVQCSTIIVPSSSYLTNLSSHDYNTSITYSCDTGYNHTSGDLIRTCLQDGSWSGSTPSCAIVQCATIIVPSSSHLPNLPSHDYNTSIIYSCDTGYNHTSGDLISTCLQNGSWSGSTPSCSIIECSTIIVPSSSYLPNLPSHDYNTSIIYSCDTGFNHTSGDLIRTCLQNGSWSGSTPSCSIVQCSTILVPSSSYLPNLASHDYNTSITYSCDTAYNHTSGDLIRTCLQNGSWSGSTPSCSIVQCSTILVPSSSYLPNLSSHDYNTSITYSCDTGYNHTSGDLIRTCLQNGSWSGSTPSCSIVTCAQALESYTSQTPNQTVHDYNTTVTYTCVTGYYLASGDLTRTCLASGAWNGTAPLCSIVTCAQALESYTTQTPNQTFHDYNTAVTYSCVTGYYLASGDLMRTCLESRAWNGTAPLCSIVTCTQAVESFTTQTPNQTVHHYNTSVTYTCVTGYYLASGDLTRTCLASGAWNGTAPLCSIVLCSAPAIIAHASIAPNQTAYNYSSTITYTCDTGYYISAGNATRSCTEFGTWDNTPPTCSRISCNEEVVVFATKLPDIVSYDYYDNVTYTCTYGYYHAAGDLARTCIASETWSGNTPACLIVTCSAVDILGSTKAPDQVTHDFNTSVTYSCMVGYVHTNGDLIRTCQANGTLTGVAPICTIKTCNSSNVAFASKSPNSFIHDYNTSVTYTCDLGYYISSGDTSLTCQADETWFGVLPTCTLVTCNEVVVNFATKAPDTTSYDYNTSVIYTCITGYNISAGDLMRTCQADFTWDGTVPVCTIVTCSKEVVAFSTVVPDQATYVYNTNVSHTCNLGYNHTAGHLDRTCNATGFWTGTLPVCTVSACLPVETTLGSISPTLITHAFYSNVTYTCDSGYYISAGDATRMCQTDGTWTGTTPTCSRVTCLAPPAVSFTTHAPVLSVYDFSATISYDCVLAYNHTAGNLLRACQQDFTWSGFEPMCNVSYCIQENSTYMTPSPNQVLHNFNDVITYSCNLGYNYTAGDVNRTCLNDGSWTGVLPYCTIITCPQPLIPDHTYIAPNISESDYNTTITYTCELGYNRTGGDETRRCTETRAWEGQEANCTLVTCDPPDSIGNGTYSPSISVYNYSNVITYTCDYGYYHTTGDLNRSCNEFAVWTGTKPACPIVQCNKIDEPHSTVSPDQPLHDFNTTATYTCNLGYNLTAGDSIRTCQANWTYDGIAPNCTIITCPQPLIPDHTYITPNISESDYNTTITYTCELGYNRTDGDETRRCTETRAWEGQEANCTLVTCDAPESTGNGTFSPSQSVYNYSNTVTYTCDYGYYQAAGDLIRNCTEFGTWSGTKPICLIVQCNKSVELHSTMNPDQSYHDFNTSVTYTCNLGYNLTDGNDVRTCQANWTYDGSPPNCTIITCPQPLIPDHTYITPNISESDYNTTITYTCELGYNRTDGDETRRCTETRAWEGQEANCTLVTCNPPVTIGNGTFSPSLSTYNYSDAVTYTCDYGYYHAAGDLSTACTENATWSGTTPTCLIVQCNKTVEPHASITPDQTYYDFNTTATYACDLGYNLTDGSDVRTCQANWTYDGTPPNCTIITCPQPLIPDHTYITPNISESDYNTTITYTCELGYNRTGGDETRRCTETRAWEGHGANCTLVTCDPPESTGNGTFIPVLSTYNYTNTVTYSCNYGYYHASGNLTRDCSEHANWTGVTPTCPIVQCSETLESHSTVLPSQPLHDFNTSVTYTCDLGYNLTDGDSIRTCQANWTWDGSPPNCTIITCPQPSIPDHTYITPNISESDYNTTITYTCELGYNRTGGDETRRCTETRAWEGQEANCTLVTCDPPDTIAYGTFLPALTSYNYSDLVTYGCNFGYYFTSGDFTKTCTENATWTGITPVCSIVQCNETLELHSTVSPSQPLHDFNTSMTYTCDLGYNLTDGDSIRTCQANWTWDGSPPNCTLVTCPQPLIPDHTYITPNISESDYNTTITYTCELGYNRTDGDEARRCTETRAWEGQEANCTLVTCDPPDTIAYGTFLPALTSYNYSDLVTYSCNLGYYFTSGDITKTCTENATWTGITPVCSIVQCNETLEAHSTMSPSQPLHDFNTSVTYTCDLGYNLTDGDSIRTCQANWTWDGLPPNCTLVTCPQPSIPDHTYITPNISESDYNTTITYTCELGYNRTGGDETRRCTETRAWEGQEANCTLVTCDPPDTIAHGTFLPALTSYNYSDLVTYSCNLGYYFTSGDITKTCTENATWTGITPVCSIVQCNEKLEPHSTISPSQPLHDFNTSVAYTCDLGYNLTDGDSIRTCQANWTWDGSPPNCTIITCPQPFIPDHTYITPNISESDYNTTITYTCELGYNRTGGDETRRCTETRAWEGQEANCTLVECDPPDPIQNGTFTPVLAVYNYSNQVDFSCNYGYYHNGGDLARVCTEFGTWNGTPALCPIVQCSRLDESYSTILPYQAMYDFNTSVSYTCILGYNLTDGDADRTCQADGNFTGTPPNCTIITCDPPVPINYTSYVPVLVEHEWNTDIDFSCDAAYHYVSGIMQTTCNESGLLSPVVDLDCSVLHTLTLDPSEPAVQWLNSTNSSTEILFQFDGLCDVVVTCIPNKLAVSHVINGTLLTVTVSEKGGTQNGDYIVSLEPFRNGRIWDDVTANVFYGEEVLNLTARIVNDGVYIAVGESYDYEAILTQGTSVTMELVMTPSTTLSIAVQDALTTGLTPYTYLSPGSFNISVTASNSVSALTVYVPVIVIYRPNNILFSVFSTIWNTTHDLAFTFTVDSIANLPMEIVNFTIDYNHGVGEFTTHSLNESMPSGTYFTYLHLFDIQGIYTVNAWAENMLDILNFTVTVNIWDSLDSLNLGFLNASGIYKTNEAAFFIFTDPPNSGFEYTIDYGDGTAIGSPDSSILYHQYNLTHFNHVFTSPGVYTVTWTAQNGGYSNNGQLTIIVQNPLPTSGYTLKPNGEKYPWLNLQTMTISNNISLDAIVPLPTNATCFFDPADGSALTHNLSFANSFFEYLHPYMLEGTFFPSFNCSNLVSEERYRFNLTVEKFKASYITFSFSSPQPLNKSDTLEVPFYIDHGDFALMPINVTLTWNFDDGSGINYTFNYDTGVYNHTFLDRGNYTISLLTEVPVSNTSNVISQPLRLGVMYFLYGENISYVNVVPKQYAMYGIDGINATYTLDFTDGSPSVTCLSTNNSWCLVNHTCPAQGYFLVTATCSNVSFVEIDSVNITCDNPFNLTLELPPVVPIPDGLVELLLHIQPTDYYLPKLSCDINMGDPILRDSFYEEQEVTHTDSFNLTFNYMALGRHTVHVHCWNLLNDTVMLTEIIVVNANFKIEGVFDRHYSQRDSPLFISAMLDTEIFDRLEINASYTEKTHTNDWKPQDTSVNIGEGTNRHSLEITRGWLADNLYRLDLMISFVEEPNNTLSELTYIRIVSPPPHAEIVGSSRREVEEAGDVLIDAFTLSYDPVYPDSLLSFSIACESYDANDFVDALDKHTNNDPSSNCDLTNTGTGQWTLDTTASNNPIDFYVVTVTVDNNRGNTSTYTQVIREQSVLNTISIRCEINCLSKVAVTSSLKLMADFNSTCAANFTWYLQQRNGSYYGTYLDISSLRETDYTGRTFILKENVLTAGYQYLVTLVMVDAVGTSYGPAYYEYLANSPPRSGSCEIKAYDHYLGFLMDTGRRLPIETTSSGYVYNSTATINVYNITCSDWQDEGFTQNTWTIEHPLFYYFFVTYNDIEKERQIVYFDPGQTSNLVSFRVGDPSNSYLATVVLRIQDVLGDYAELNYSVNSIPPLTTDDTIGYTTAEQLANVSSYIMQFDDQMIKANRSWDHRTLARKIIDIASVYNALLLNNSIEITLGPADLLNLGYQRHPDTGEYLVWSDYMTIIVDEYDTTVADYISNTGERYASYILESVVTWPTTKRITIPAIESISRALNISMAVDDYTNVTAVVYASTCVDKFAASLASYANDRTFPNTDQLDSAMIGTFDLIGNILAELHAVLTPNLPEDPTIDEMRNFLEYMRDFKTTDEIVQEPLSLQEQSFLAQKQLQKYFVEKYIKTQAGQQAMPLVTNALQNFTYILGKLSNVGQGEKVFQNNFLYVSTEIKLASTLENSWVYRPNAAMLLGSLSNVVTTNCQATEVLLRSFIFAQNPYFWGTNGDRVSSVVPVFEIAGATLTDSNLKFTLDNAELPLCKYQTPAYDKSDPNKMVYVLFDRKYLQDDIIVYVRQNTTELVYQLYFNPVEKPSVVEKRYAYTVEITSSMWTDEDGHKLIIPASEFAFEGKIWIGIRPILQRSTDVTLLALPICANVSSVSCLAYTTDAAGNDFWDSNMCQVSRDSTRAQTVCECTNTWPSSKMTVGTTHYVTPNIMNFDGVVQGTYPLGRDPVLGLIIATLCLYCLLVAWAWREDELDKYKFAYSLLIDNDIADSYFYIMRVYTGLRSGSGTKSKIGFVIVGESNKTIVRILDDEAHVGFGRGSVRTFVMSNRRPLGELISLRIWHDDTGDTEASWFLNKITITDLQTGTRCVFMSDQWLDYDQGDHKVERVLTAKPYEKAHSLKDLYSYIMAEHHLWISILIRPLRSNFTRIQRLSCLIGMIYMTMVVTVTIVKTPDEVAGMLQVIIGPFRFSRENFETAMISVSIATLFVMTASFFFRNCDSPTGTIDIKTIWRRMYVMINSFLKIDKSVLGTTFIPPAEDAVQYGVHWLPDACLYIGWTILGMSVMITTYWLVIVSEKWRQIKSEEWLTTVLCGFIGSFLIIETAKCLVVFLFYVVTKKLIYEPPDPQIDVESLKEITRHNSASLRISPDFDTTLEKPKSPDEETLKNNRKKRIGNHQLLRMFYQLALFSGILYIVYTISYESRDPNSYYLKSDIENMFGFKESVKDMASFTTWLSGRFLDTYFAHSYFGASYDSAFKMYINDLVNVRVGPARLRQLRVMPENCHGPLAAYIGTCYGNYDAKNTETSDYCLGWRSQPCPVSEKSSYFSSAAWLYTSPNDVWGFTTVADYDSYNAGGYFMKLDVNKDISQIIFSELVKYSWYDRQMRAAILEFTVYNANSNLFAYCKFVAEVTEVGGILPYIDIQVFRLYLNSGPNGNFILFLEFAFFLLVIAGTVYIVYDMCTDPKAFIKSFWNWLDVLALIMAYITVSIFIYKIFIIQRTIEVFNTDKNAYVGFENLSFYDFVVNTSHGVLVFILSVRVSRILGYSGKINEMAAVISNSAKDLGGFFIVFSVTYLSFVTLGTHLFGKNVGKYRDMFETYGTLTEGVIGKNRIADILSTNPGYAEFYYFLYVLFVLLTLQTMAAAILNFSISDVRRESKDLKATSIVEVIIETLRNLLGRIGGSLGRQFKQKAKDQRRDSEELNDILNDFRYFIRGVMATEKASDRYKLVTPDIPDDGDSGMGYR